MQSDRRLSDLYHRGVDPAFDELVDRYRASLTAFAGAIVGAARAEDVVQESLIKAHRAMASEAVEEPRAWLYRIVRNTALNEIRDGQKHEHSELAEIATSDSSPEREVEGREEFEALIAALAALPEAQRQAIVDRELGGYTHEEIARELEISTGATKQLIFRARKGLRNAFGALIPVPVIVWLASEMTGAFAAASSAGAVAGATATAGAAGGAGGAAAGAGGVFAGIAAGGAAKVAAVAVVATGTVAAGVAVEQRVVNGSPDSRPAIEQTVSGSSAGVEVGPDGTPVLVPTTAGAGERSDAGKPASDRGEPSDDLEAGVPADEGRPTSSEADGDFERAPGGERPDRPTARPVGGSPAATGRPPRPSGGDSGRPGAGGRPSGTNGGPGSGARPAPGSGGSGKPSGGPARPGSGPSATAGGSAGSGGSRPSRPSESQGGGKPRSGPDRTSG